MFKYILKKYLVPFDIGVHHFRILFLSIHHGDWEIKKMDCYDFIENENGIYFVLMKHFGENFVNI